MLMVFILCVMPRAFILCVVLETLSRGWGIYSVCCARELFIMLGTFVFRRT